MSRMSRTSIAKVRRMWGLLAEIVRMAEIGEATVAVGEGVPEAAGVGADAADVTEAVAAAGMAAATAVAGAGIKSWPRICTD